MINMCCAVKYVFEMSLKCLFFFKLLIIIYLGILFYVYTNAFKAKLVYKMIYYML